MAPRKFALPPAKEAARSRSPPPHQRSVTIPLASALIEAGPASRTAPRSLPQTAPVNVCIYKVTDCAEDLWSALEGQGSALFQVQVDHAARSSIGFRFLDEFKAFLAELQKTDSTMPGTLEELEEQGRIRLVIAKSDDPHEVKLVPF